MRIFALLTLCMFCICSCAQSGAVKTNIYKDRRMEVSLRSVASREEAPLSGAHSYPAAFEVEDLKYLLRSIKYREKGLFGWAEARRVFSANELYRMGPHLVDAFAKAAPGDEIVFQTTAAKTGNLFSSARYSNGMMFVEDKKLHCIFGNINVRPEMSEMYDGDPRKEYAGALSMLVTNDWQRLVTDEKGTHYNWIEIDYERALTEKEGMERAMKRRAERRRAIDLKRRRERTGWEDWEPDKALGE